MTKLRPKLYFENLDALRFIAFLSVFVFHFNARIPASDNGFIFFINSVFKNGYLGVDFFFVLSGFLITYLLLREEVLNSKYNVMKFWARRALRIWPLYFLIVFYGFVIFKWLNSSNAHYHETAESIWYLTFLPNFNIIMNGYPICTSLIVLWSVGIEEQFYLVWPLLFKLKKYRIPIILVLIVFSLTFRAFYLESFYYLTYHTFSFIGDLLIGCLLAVIAFNKNWAVNSLTLSKKISLLVYIAGVSLIFFGDSIINNRSGFLFSKNLIFCTFFAFVIYDQIFVLNSWFKIGKIRLLERLGKYTYGMYCLHPIAIMLGLYISRFAHLEGNMYWVIGAEMFISLVLTVLLSMLSYSMIESPFLKIKEFRFSVR